MINRAIVIILDSLGIGEAPDAEKYGDVGSDTLGHIYKYAKVKLPNLKKLGLYNIDEISIQDKEENPTAIYGKAKEMCAGKNSPVGHWEIAGYIKEQPFSVYPNGFPEELIKEFIEKTGIEGVLYNNRGSGTELLKQYGMEHIKTGYPIIYTSADSVFQIAAHEDIIPVEKLYEMCKIAREILNRPEYNVGTVIARPFIGDSSENFVRTYNRRDYEMETFGKTMLDVFKENGKKVLSIGKIEDLFTGRGIDKAIHTSGNAEGIEKTIEAIKNSGYDMIFTNLVDFDMLYGHRNNIEGYKNALEYFDSKLPEILKNLRDDDILIISADHGNDPYTPSTDHSREYIPIIVYGKSLKNNVNLGIRETYADISATILDFFGFEKLAGTSFKNIIEK